MRTFGQDLRFGMRVLWGSPGFTTVAVLTLALGMAVNTAVFSWIDAVLLRPLPGVSDSHRLVAFETTQPDGEGRNTSYADYRDYRDNLKLVAGLALSKQPNSLSLGEGERAQRVWSELVSGNYFAVLGVKPLLGRFFLPEEQGDKPGAYPVVVIGERLWRSRFNADPGVIGERVRVNQRELTIVGVAPKEFRGIAPGLIYEIWAPLMMAPQLNVIDEGLLFNRRARGINAIARLAPGAAIEQARAEVATVANQLARAHRDTNTGFSATLLPIWKSHTGAQGLLLAPLQILMAMCLVVLLIACVNVANLLLARSADRQRELSIRLALGAGRGRLARQLLTEALLLAGLGTLAGIPMAMWIGQSLLYLAPRGMGMSAALDIRINGTVLGFTILICAAAALASGLWPALHAVRPDVNESLKEGGRGGTSAARSHRMRGLFVVSEVALALVALVGAGLFAASFRNTRAIQPGFDARNVLVSSFYLSTSGYTADQRKQFCLRLRDRLESAPGVVGVSYADTIPLGFGLGPGQTLQIEGYLPGQSENMTIPRSLVALGFFGVMRIPLLEGREFTRQDELNTAPVLIVNQAFARRFFKDRNPIGRKIHAWGKWRTVVGLVKDTKQYTLIEAPRPYLYAPAQQIAAPPVIAFYVRTAGNPDQMTATLRREAAAIDPNAGAFDAMPLAEYIAAPLFPQRMAASLLSALGVLSMLLAAVGLYSVMAYAVSQRTHEIGIRMALGARPGDVLGMVVRQGMALTAAGLAVGVGVALAATHLVASMLVNVSATDPLVFAGAALFLGLVALAASFLPARRATRIDPIFALRHQ
ncbi:MAG: ABC transporter permease [Bryobacterales bacterium]|nr:ABC transporter permease [Bryobacterales bacterium]